MLKLARYSTALQTMARVSSRKREELVLTLFAVGILGGGFVEELQRQRDETLPTVCPHCGHDVRMAREGPSTIPRK